MKKNFVCFLVTIVLCSCNSSGKKTISTPTKKHINVVENVNGYNVAYTEDGHTILYTNDSIGNYSVYYVKFENRAEKYGQKGIGEKFVRAEMDATLTTLNSFVTIHGGAFCEIDSFMGYKVCFFDEQLKGDSLENTNVTTDFTQLEEMGAEHEVKRISALLNVAFDIATIISKNNPRGWNNITYALEPTQRLLAFNVMKSNDVYDQRVQMRLPKLRNIAEELTKFYFVLQKKKNGQEDY